MLKSNSAVAKLSCDISIIYLSKNYTSTYALEVAPFMSIISGRGKPGTGFKNMYKSPPASAAMKYKLYKYFQENAVSCMIPISPKLLVKMRAGSCIF